LMVYKYQQNEKYFMEKIPAWIERLLLPKLNEITGEIKATHTRIDSVEKEIVDLRNEMLTKFDALDAKVAAADAKVDSVRNEMISRFDSLETRMPMMEKIAELEVRLAEIEKKILA
jgi:polyhydroxyalkanoate synthesis regulator phasin